MSDLQNSTDGSPSRISPKRRWFIIVLIVASLAAGLVAGGVFIGKKLNSTASGVDTTQGLVQDLHASSKQRSTELTTLQHEVKSLKAGTAAVNKLLAIAGQAVTELEAQDAAICAALPGCKPVMFVIPPATTAAG